MSRNTVELSSGYNWNVSIYTQYTIIKNKPKVHVQFVTKCLDVNERFCMCLHKWVQLFPHTPYKSPLIHTTAYTDYHPSRTGRAMRASKEKQWTIMATHCSWQPVCYMTHSCLGDHKSVMQSGRKSLRHGWTKWPLKMDAGLKTVVNCHPWSAAGWVCQ